MNLPQYACRRPKVIYFILLVMIVGGVLGFEKLGKKENATFVIKSASILCYYKGATPAQVEMLITEPIEREVQGMRRIKKITSESHYGYSKIQVELDAATPPREIPQLWDELRRKTLNVQPKLPEGASQITVSDDFGDVFGLYYALVADDGFTWEELRDWAQRIKTSLVGVSGVQKIALYGEQNPVVNIYIDLSRLANFEVRPEEIISTISQQNAVVGSGVKNAGEVRIQIVDNGSYKNLDDIANQLLTTSDGKQFRLGYIARVEQGYSEPPTTIMSVNGQRAIGLGLSTDPKVDVVKVGRDVGATLSALESQMPYGLSVVSLYPEDAIAREANNTFIANLFESVAIVVAVIMLVMGFRAGVLIGSSLLFSIGGTILCMQFIGEGLNRTSLAGFIIAMGMLVDNAIVVTDNAQNAIRRGASVEDAVTQGANAPRWSLLGATLIAILSFLPLYLAPSSVAEIVKPLFVVLTLSLILSWLLALTQTPLFGSFILKGNTGAAKEPYSGRFYGWFDRFLGGLLRLRWLVVGVVVVLFAGSLLLMARLPQNFFPSLDKPYFRADIYLPDGFNIRATEANMKQMESWLMSQPEVRNVSMTVGSTPPRYYLASSSVALRPSFGNILVELHDKSQSEEVESRFNAYVTSSFPDVWIRSSLFKLSPVPDATVEFGFVGDSIQTLIDLTTQAQGIMWRNPHCDNIRNSWGSRVPVWSPEYSQTKGQRVGISRMQLAKGVTVATQGYRLGEYRKGDVFMPILLKDAAEGSYNLSNMEALPLFNDNGVMRSIDQAVDGYKFYYSTNVIKRYNRQRVMMAQCDPARDYNAKQLYGELLDSVRQYVPLPDGYRMVIFGDQESESESNAALAKNMPLTLILMVVILLLLFGNYRQPVIILLMIPLIFIGVVLGLIVLGKSFNFFSLLGLLGLVGMNIKNAVVLVAQINEEQERGLAPYDALIVATRSRIVPVVMASGTTILGMLPLLFDAMFGGMAATIMGGLFVATFLTICVLPVVYAIFYGIRKQS